MTARLAPNCENVSPRFPTAFAGVLHSGGAGPAFDQEGVAKLADGLLQGRCLANLRLQGHSPHAGDHLAG